MNGGTCQEHRSGRAVVCALGRVLLDSTAEFGEAHDQDAVVEFRGAEVSDDSVCAVCQMFMLTSCERLGFGYPTPCTIASRPSSSNSAALRIEGCSATSSFSLINAFVGRRSVFRFLA